MSHSYMTPSNIITNKLIASLLHPLNLGVDAASKKIILLKN